MACIENSELEDQEVRWGPKWHSTHTRIVNYIGMYFFSQHYKELAIYICLNFCIISLRYKCSTQKQSVIE